jgi:hypothetical protein
MWGRLKETSLNNSSEQAVKKLTCRSRSRVRKLRSSPSRVVQRLARHEKWRAENSKQLF